MFTRRSVLSGFGFMAALSVIPRSVFAQVRKLNTGDKVDVIKLNQAGARGDKILGSETAPVTIIEYASLTCSHCKSFHENTLPKLKSDFIDTGKVRYILREFAFDPVSKAGFMLARCVPEEQYFSFIDIFFAQQPKFFE